MSHSHGAGEGNEGPLPGSQAATSLRPHVAAGVRALWGLLQGRWSHSGGVPHDLIPSEALPGVTLGLGCRFGGPSDQATAVPNPEVSRPGAGSISEHNEVKTGVEAHPGTMTHAQEPRSCRTFPGAR